jgi:UDP-N-acetylglucosamine 4,6-dehydratase/5-epimerase
MLVKQLLFEHQARTVRVLDNDEYGLSKIKRWLHSDKLRLLLGDIRDVDRIRMAVEGSDIVYHLAACKNLEVSEYNPIEACKTNVTGISNVVEATLSARKPPTKFIFVSSDKAVHYTSLYGATKLIGEKITLWADKIQDQTRFSVARPGNFFTSRGNVFEIWDEQQREGKPLTVTHPEMQRYFISTEAAALFLIDIACRMKGGEIFIPHMEEKRILDLAKARSPNILQVGLRVGEKLREQLFSEDEKRFLKEEDGLLVIRP